MLKLLMPLVAAAALFTACSSTNTPGAADSGADPDAGAADTAAPEPFALTSSTITEGATFPKDHTCNGKDVSPALSWGPGPEGTLSYAIVFNDVTFKFLHSIIYDIPATVTSLPQGVETAYQPKEPAGAKQTQNYKGATEFGYTGPCPPTNEHTYEFVLYALSVETVPNMSQSTTLKAAETEIKKHSLGSVKLTGKYKQP